MARNPLRNWGCGSRESRPAGERDARRHRRNAAGGPPNNNTANALSKQAVDVTRTVRRMQPRDRGLGRGGDASLRRGPNSVLSSPVPLESG
jgi:hypothetical protein